MRIQLTQSGNRNKKVSCGFMATQMKLWSNCNFVHIKKVLLGNERDRVWAIKSTAAQNKTHKT
jgi:hypothetical protein